MDWRTEAESIFKKHGYSQIRPFMTIDFGRVQQEQGISVIIPKPESINLIDQIRSDLPTSLVAFAGTSKWFGTMQESGMEVVIGQGSDQFDILRLAQTDAINYGMDTEDVIRKLQQYDRQYGIDIVAAETDTLIFRLLRLLSVSERHDFAEDFAEFCPDIVGYYGEDDFAELLISTREISCWWD